jgi:streptomycin 6-kinase
MPDSWTYETSKEASSSRDPGLASEGLRVFKELSRASHADMLLATDMHAGNVLRAQRKPWLVIDPKPFVGDPAYDATHHLLNCVNRLRVNPDGGISHFAALLEVSSERVRLWIFARAAAEPGDEWGGTTRIALARRLAP